MFEIKTVPISIDLYAAISIAHKRPQRIKGRDMRRLDCMLDAATYKRLSSLQAALSEYSHLSGLPVLSMSELSRIIISWALQHNCCNIPLGSLHRK